jgi:hypothetical protein
MAFCDDVPMLKTSSLAVNKTVNNNNAIAHGPIFNFDTPYTENLRRSTHYARTSAIEDRAEGKLYCKSTD